MSILKKTIQNQKKNIYFFFLFFAFFVLFSLWMNRKLLSSGEMAPSFQVKTWEGKEMSLSSLRGKPVILYFWATWCAVCKTNLKLFSFQKQYKDTIFLSVVAEARSIRSVQKIVQKYKIKFPVLMADTRLLQQYRIQKFPTTYFLDRNGKVVFRDTGALTPFGIWWRNAFLRYLAP